MQILSMLVVGAVAGWLAGQMMKGRGFGLVGNVLVGIVGAVIGNYLFGWLGVSTGPGVVAAIVRALVGALLLIFVVGLVKRG